MRTTVRLDDDLLRRAKRVAAESGQTLTALIQDSMRRELAGRSSKRRRKTVKLVTDGSGGPAPGVDLDDTSSLLDRMDAIDGPLRR